MLLTIAASWLVASTADGKRRAGFWTFLASNAVWAVWGWSSHAWALVVMQLALAAMNIRGAEKNQPDEDSG